MTPRPQKEELKELTTGTWSYKILFNKGSLFEVKRTVPRDTYGVSPSRGVVRAKCEVCHLRVLTNDIYEPISRGMFMLVFMWG